MYISHLYKGNECHKANALLSGPNLLTIVVRDFLGLSSLQYLDLFLLLDKVKVVEAVGFKHVMTVNVDIGTITEAL